MTLGKLIKELQKLQKTVGPRAPVVVEGKTFLHEEWSHTQISEIGYEFVSWSIDDSIFTPSGNERMKQVVTLKGHQ